MNGPDATQRLYSLLDRVHSSQDELLAVVLSEAVNQEINFYTQQGATLQNSVFLSDLMYIAALFFDYFTTRRRILYQQILFEFELDITKELVRRKASLPTL